MYCVIKNGPVLILTEKQFKISHLSSKSIKLVRSVIGVIGNYLTATVTRTTMFFSKFINDLCTWKTKGSNIRIASTLSFHILIKLIIAITLTSTFVCITHIMNDTRSLKGHSFIKDTKAAIARYFSMGDKNLIDVKTKHSLVSSVFDGFD